MILNTLTMKRENQRDSSFLDTNSIIVVHGERQVGKTSIHSDLYPVIIRLVRPFNNFGTQWKLLTTSSANHRPRNSSPAGIISGHNGNYRLFKALGLWLIVYVHAKNRKRCCPMNTSPRDPAWSTWQSASPKDSPASATGEAHRRYTRLVNSREGWSGFLWQGRFIARDDSEKTESQMQTGWPLNPWRCLAGRKKTGSAVKALHLYLEPAG